MPTRLVTKLRALIVKVLISRITSYPTYGRLMESEVTATIPTIKVSSKYAVTERTREAMAEREDGVGLEAPLVQAGFEFLL